MDATHTNRVTQPSQEIQGKCCRDPMSFIHDKQRRENHSQPTRNVLCSRACASGDLALVLLVDSCLLPSVQGVGRNQNKVDRLDREEHGRCLKGWGCSAGDTRRIELAGPGAEACRRRAAGAACKSRGAVYTLAQVIGK